MSIEMKYGKHKGKTIEQIGLEDDGYLAWLRDNTDPKDVKNGGKYTKNNLALIAEINRVLNSLGAVPKLGQSAPKKIIPQTTKQTVTLETLSSQINNLARLITNHLIKQENPENVIDDTVPF